MNAQQHIDRLRDVVFCMSRFDDDPRELYRLCDRVDNAIGAFRYDLLTDMRAAATARYECPGEPGDRSDRPAQGPYSAPLATVVEPVDREGWCPPGSTGACEARR